jgi:hypothetical protein
MFRLVTEIKINFLEVDEVLNILNKKKLGRDEENRAVYGIKSFFASGAS